MKVDSGTSSSEEAHIDAVLASTRQCIAEEAAFREQKRLERQQEATARKQAAKQ